MADLLLEVYHAGYCAGARLPLELPRQTSTADLVLITEARHRVEIREPRGWNALDAPIHSDEIPGWLLRQQQQADPVRQRATTERQLALGDSGPPAGREDLR